MIQYNIHSLKKREKTINLRNEEEKAVMQFKMVHENYNVFDLQKSLSFYKEALGLTDVRRK